MARIAYLGPACSFSHDLVKETFPGVEHVACSTLHNVVEAVGKGDCEKAVVPFYNTTRKSIEESQIELIAHKNRVFVADVLPLPVKHYLCGFGALNDLTEIRSKGVVFHQISKWQKRHFPNVTLREDYQSTSAAIMSLLDGKPGHAAAVGTRSATKEYGVPILKPNIHNKPNLTLFFVLTPQMPKPEEMDHVLMCVTNVENSYKEQIEATVLKNRCSITSNWPLEMKQKPRREAYFLEISGQYSKLDLHSTVAEIKNEFPRAFLVGGYAGKCITQLLWQAETKR